MSRFLCLLWLSCAPLAAIAAPQAHRTEPRIDAPYLARITAAQQQLDAWQLAAAAEQASALLLLAPQDASVQLLAAEVLFQRGHAAVADALLRSALTDGTRLPAAQAQRGKSIAPRITAAAQARRGMQRSHSEHFAIYAADKDCIVADAAVPVLEAAWQRIGAHLQLTAAWDFEKITVVFYRNVGELAAATGLLPQEIESSGTVAVAKYHQLMLLSPLATSQGYAWADTLAHELTHLLVAKRSHDRVPVWLQEGLAKTYERAWRDAPGAPQSRGTERRLRAAAKDNTLISFAAMHPSMAKLPNQRDAALAFAEVSSLVDDLRQRFGDAALAKVLTNLGRNQSFEAAWSSAFAPLPQVEQQWRKRLRAQPQLRPSPLDAEAVDIQFQQPADTQDAQRQQSGAAAAQLRLAELLSMRQHEAAASVALHEAVRLGAGLAPTADFRLAQSLAKQQQSPQARHILQQNLARHPQHLPSQLLLGQLLLKDNQATAGRTWLYRYIWHNPFVPEVHAAIAQSFAGVDAQAQARALRHAELAAAPRQPVKATKPAPGVKVQVLSAPWQWLRIDGGAPVPLPLWDEPMAPGPHQLQLCDVDGTALAAAQPLQVQADMPVVRLQPAGDPQAP